VIEAGAGTGKTSTLRLVATTQPRRRALYVAYNKAIASDAKRSFPASVTIRSLRRPARSVPGPGTVVARRSVVAGGRR
jgi:hypothetical protein